MECEMLRDDRIHFDRNWNLTGFKYDEAWNEYKRQFKQGMDQEPVEHKKANAGRRQANIWINKVRR